MKTFYFKLVIFLVLCLSLTYTITLLTPWHYFNYEYPIWKYKLDMLQLKVAHRNLIIGDSRSITAFIPDRLGKQYFNLSFSGSSPLEGYFALKHLVEKNNVFDTLVVSFSPFHFVKSDCFWHRSLKYGFYSGADIYHIFFQMNKSRERFWALDENPMSGYSYYWHFFKTYFFIFKFPSTVQPEISNSLFGRGGQNAQVYNNIKQQMGHYMFEQTSTQRLLNFETRQPDFKPKEIQVTAFCRLLELGLSHKSVVIVKMVPMNLSSHLVLRKRYLKTFYEWLQTIQMKHPEVIYLMGTDVYKNCYFGDPNHLNRLGAEKFSTEFRMALDDLAARSAQAVK